MQCGDSHRVKDCTNVNKDNNTVSKTFCSNCKKEGHTASSRVCPILKDHVKELIVIKKTKVIDQIKSNSTMPKPTYATTTKTTLNQNIPPIPTPNKETTELKQVVTELVMLVKSLLAIVSNKITIPETLQKFMNE
jgi:hypothetical protein